MRSRSLISIVVGSVLLVLAAATNAQSRTPVDVTTLGPQVGERVPDFNLPDQNGRKHSLQSLMGPNGILLLFHRSAEW